MNIYEIGSMAEKLASNSYPGRGIVLGVTPDGSTSVAAYFIMGRSVNSRNRVFLEEPDGIRTEAHDPSLMQDPSLIIYHPVRELARSLIVTNGDQTDTIRDGMERGETFEAALRTRKFEHDGPNWTPRISGLQAMDEGIRRRIVVIPFRNHLREDEVDRNLEAKLLSETDAILRWLIQGYLRYHHQGLVPPKAVIEATRGYFEEQDPVRRFVDEYYVENPAGKIYARDIYADYKHWCAENGEEVRSQRMLGIELQRLGIKREKGAKSNYYRLERI